MDGDGRADFSNRCGCGFLKQIADSANSPVQFVAEFNEFQFLTDDSYWILRYCPFCGLPLEPSTRDRLFVEIDREKINQANERIRKHRTLAEVINEYGPPDSEMPVPSDEEDNQGDDAATIASSYYHIVPGTIVVVYSKAGNVISIAYAPKLKKSEG